MTPDKLRAATGCTVEQAEAFAPLLAVLALVLGFLACNMKGKE
jgi:hypothetical protein